MVPYQPGLIPAGPAHVGGDEIEAAVRVAFEELAGTGVLGPIERAKQAALVKAAAALDRGMAYGKVSVATSNVLKQVMEGLDSLPRPTTGADRELDALDAALAALTQQALEQGAGAS